jgi:riboflavin synthase
MAWNIEALILLAIATTAFLLGVFTERDAHKESKHQLELEIRSNYREMENLREIIFHYENRQNRHSAGQFPAKGHR